MIGACEPITLSTQQRIQRLVFKVSKDWSLEESLLWNSMACFFGLKAKPTIEMDTKKDTING